MNEIYVSLKDLVAECIRKLKFIVIFTIIFTILLGTVGYAKANKTRKDAHLVKKTDDKTTEEKINNLSKEDYNNLMSYVRAVEQGRQEQSSMDDSIIMDINPYSVDTVNLQYLISDENISSAQNAKKLLVNFITDGSLAKNVSDEFDDLKEADINELIYCSQDIDSTNEKINVSSIVCVNIYGNSEKQVKELDTLVQNNINEYMELISVSNKVQLINDSYHVAKSDDLVSAKKEMISGSVRWNDTINASRANIDDTIKNLADEILTEKKNKQEENDSINNQAEINSKSMFFKSIAVGGVGGIIVAVLMILFAYLLNGTIKTNIDLKMQYDLYDFGNITIKKEKRLDILADKYFYGKRLYENCGNEKMTFFNIVTICNNLNIDKIVFIGNVCDNHMEFVNNMMDFLEKNNIDASYIGDILSDTSASVNVHKTDNIILIETLRSSRYSEVKREKTICDKISCNMIGYVTIS